MEVPVHARRVHFGAFEANLRSGELRKHGLKIKLQDQPFQVLALLLERPGEVVTREELRNKLWPADTFVDFDVGLNTAIKRLREALSDTAESPRYVETLPRRGYRFIASVEDATPLPLPTSSSPDGVPEPVQAATLPLANPMSDTPAAPTAQPHLRWRWVAVLALAAILATVVRLNVGGLRYRLLGRPTAGGIRSIAVLPLEDLSGDSSQEYLVDGMTDALITDLAQVSALRVISRTSAMHYKGSRKTLPEIARELHVDAVVEGAILRSGNRVRITAQLVEASSDRHLWAEKYERELLDVLALQDEVARAIANQVQIQLTPQELIRLAARVRPVDPVAQEAYLRGRYEWNKWTEEGLKNSIDYFGQAIQIDPAYAQAWAGMADAYSLLGDLGIWPAQVALPKAKAAALRALELDETLSEAHVSLAGVMLHLEWSWSEAEKESLRAIALNPNNAVAHQWVGYYMMVMGRFDEAIAEMKRARELDPLSLNTQNTLGAALYRAGRYDEALQQMREVPDGDANSALRHRRMAEIYERKGMQKAAITELLAALRLEDKKELAAFVNKKYLSFGYWEAKKTLLRRDAMKGEQRARNRDMRAPALDIAADYALLGEKNKAFEWLEKAFQEREVPLVYLKVDTSFEALRSDPRFNDLLRRMGLQI